MIFHDQCEIRQIFAQKGFSGDVLDRGVAVITANPRLWVDTMLTEEHGLQIEGRSPWRAGTATFMAFVLVGFIPVVPFLLPLFPQPIRWLWSSILTALTFAGIGWMKSVVLEHSKWRSVLETLFSGGGAALLAYLIGMWLRHAYGVN